MHAPVRSGFDTRNREEGEALIAKAYADNRLRITGGAEDFRITQDRTDIGEIQLDNYYNTLTHDYVFEPLPSLVVIRVLEGTADIESASHAGRGCPGDVMLTTLPGEGYHGWVDSARLQVTSLDFSLLDQVTDEPGTALARHYRTEPVRPSAARQWQQTVNYLTGTVLDGPATTSPLVLGAAGRLLAATFLTVFDPDIAEVSAHDRTDAMPMTVRRAVSFMEANPDLDIGVADIARAAYVSSRALQLAFRRHLDTTPMRYLRRVRLDRAHADLQAAIPGEGTTVTAVAARWGYARPSRFAADYRAAYGRHPHRTLQDG